MTEEKEYTLKEDCYGCKSENELRHVHIHGNDLTLCHSCEQRIIGAVLNGEL